MSSQTANMKGNIPVQKGFKGQIGGFSSFFITFANKQLMSTEQKWQIVCKVICVLGHSSKEQRTFLSNQVQNSMTYSLFVVWRVLYGSSLRQGVSYLQNKQKHYDNSKGKVSSYQFLLKIHATVFITRSMSVATGLHLQPGPIDPSPENLRDSKNI